MLACQHQVITKILAAAPGDSSSWAPQHEQQPTGTSPKQQLAAGAIALAPAVAAAQVQYNTSCQHRSGKRQVLNQI
jgi:hypothetical protein